MKSGRKIWNNINKLIDMLDKENLWWIGLLLLAGAFLPIAILKEGSVFEIHDQLDETLFTYVVNAKYLGTGVKQFPEMLGGINASGMQPSAVLFILLYKIFPVFPAFILQYFIVCASAYFGMYLLVREWTNSSLLATMIAGIFSMLPMLSVYGLSVMGVPLLVYAFESLYQKKRKILSYLIIVFFGLTTHLVLIGYVVLSFWGLAVVILLCKKQYHKWFFGGFGLLTGVYLFVNYSLFYELFFGQGDYISHREELVNYGSSIWENSKRLFLESGQHVPSYHKYLIIPILILLIIEGICYYKKLENRRKKQYQLAIGIFITLIVIAAFYGFCNSQIIADLKNSATGFLRYFQMERYYWLYPSLWYMEAALLLGILWQQQLRWLKTIGKLILVIILLLPTAKLVKDVSIPYTNINQINNGSGITGYITWENFYAEDLMKEIDTFLGREKSTYRIAHLGISPAPSLMYGFYTIDGYSNNYPLSYKHEFRQIIEKELQENEEMRLYFDNWGSRCYLFNHVTGTYYMLGKNNTVKYQNLQINTQQMKAMGCEYLFSGAEIEGAKEIGMELLEVFETEKSYWKIWLYQLI